MNSQLYIITQGLVTLTMPGYENRPGRWLALLKMVGAVSTDCASAMVFAWRSFPADAATDVGSELALADGDAAEGRPIRLKGFIYITCP